MLSDFAMILATYCSDTRKAEKVERGRSGLMYSMRYRESQTKFCDFVSILLEV